MTSYLYSKFLFPQTFKVKTNYGEFWYARVKTNADFKY